MCVSLGEQQLLSGVSVVAIPGDPTRQEEGRVRRRNEEDEAKKVWELYRRDDHLPLEEDANRFGCV